MAPVAAGVTAWSVRPDQAPTTMSPDESSLQESGQHGLVGPFSLDTLQRPE